jgi:hypothetical protein
MIPVVELMRECNISFVYKYIKAGTPRTKRARDINLLREREKGNTINTRPREEEQWNDVEKQRRVPV